jgi:hypothetical protein
MGPDSTFVHIGLAKTGTTTLQQDVFSKTPAIAYLGKNLVSEPLDQARRQLTRAPEARFDAAAVRKAFEAGRAGRPGAALFSDEDLSVWKFLRPETMGFRIAEIFDAPRLIYVTRRVRDWVMSQYFFRLSTWRPDTLGGPDRWLRVHLAELDLGSDVAEIRFTETLRLFHQAAGAPPVLVLPFELMARDIAGFLARIEAFMGLDGELVALAPAAAGTPRKPRMDRRMAGFIRALALLDEDRSRFLDLMAVCATRAVAEDRQAFEVLASDRASAAAAWQGWMQRIEKRMRRALAAGDEALGEALELYDDYALEPELLAALDRIEAQETRAMAADFGVDLSPWGYASVAAAAR